MPSAAVDFRASCGCFLPVFLDFMCKRARQKIVLRVAMLKLKRRVDGAVAGLLLSYLFWGSFLLLQCGDVESNPGPNSSQSRDNMRQTRLTSAGTSGSRVSLERPVNPQGDASNQPVKEPTLSDVMTMLHSMKTSMDTKFDEVKQEMHVLREEYMAMREELSGLKQEVGELRQQNEDLRKMNNDLAVKMDDLERKTDDLEGRSKRNNLIFYGLARKERETNADCEDMLKDLITDKLELSRDVEFDRAHRVSSKPDSPIIVRCVFYKQKVDILKAKRKLKRTNIFIGEDFSTRVRDMRKKLTPHLRKVRDDGKRVTMVYDHLLIDGKRFTVGSADRLVEMK